MAAGATYEPIATTTLGSAQSSITFSSIPSTYTDLRLIWVGTVSATPSDIRTTFNSDTGSNYSRTVLYGDGTSAASSRSTGATYIYTTYNGLSTTIPSLCIVDIFSYAGSTYKTALFNVNEDRNGSGSVNSTVGLWRSTAAITSVTFTTSANNFAIGTTATLYGIKAA